jgi:hypothetical protein
MNFFIAWLLTRIAKHVAWNFRSDRALHQRQVLMAWERIMHVAVNDEVNDNSDVLREMSVDCHEKVWGCKF